MLSMPTLLAARQHMSKMLDDARDGKYNAADALVFQVALDCVEHCIAETERTRELEKVNREIDLAISRIMAGSGMRRKEKICW